MEVKSQLYRQQMAWAKRQFRNPLMWFLAPLLLLYMLSCWIGWQLIRRFPDGFITPGGMAKLIWATIVGSTAVVLGVTAVQLLRSLPFLLAVVWSIWFHVGPASNATNPYNQQHAPTVAPTAYATHTRSNWLDSLTFLSPQAAQKLRAEPDVTNVMVISESDGRVKISANLKTNFVGNRTDWRHLTVYPFAISNVSVTGTFVVVTVDGNNFNLYVGQAFILAEDPTVAYVVSSDGTVYQAEAGVAGSHSLVPVETSLPSPHLLPNAQMSLPE